MLLKTYDSDIFNNWVKTDWIDGAGGITEITSIDITAKEGKLTMDALNFSLLGYKRLFLGVVVFIVVLFGVEVLILMGHCME